MPDATHTIPTPAEMLTDSRLTDGDCRVWGLLASFGDFGTLANCHPSLGAIARKGQRNRAAVAKSLKNLEACGWVSRQQRKTQTDYNETTIYILHRCAIVATERLVSVQRLVATERLVAETDGGSRSNAQGVVAVGRPDLKPLPKAITKSHLPTGDMFPEASKPKTEMPAIPKAKAGEPPCTIAEALARAVEIGLAPVEAEKWWYHHDARGWLLNGKPMQRWKSAMQTWRLQSSQWAGEKAANKPTDYEVLT